MTDQTAIDITVHERTDQHGYVVKIAIPDDPSRVTRWPVDDLDEAKKLAASVARFVQGGGDVDVFLPASESSTESH